MFLKYLLNKILRPIDNKAYQQKKRNETKRGIGRVGFKSLDDSNGFIIVVVDNKTVIYLDPQVATLYWEIKGQSNDCFPYWYCKDKSMDLD
jgi:hypothetical protein